MFVLLYSFCTFVHVELIITVYTNPRGQHNDYVTGLEDKHWYGKACGQRIIILSRLIFYPQFLCDKNNISSKMNTKGDTAFLFGFQTEHNHCCLSMRSFVQPMVNEDCRIFGGVQAEKYYNESKVCLLWSPLATTVESYLVLFLAKM